MKFQQQAGPTIKYAKTELKTRVVSVTQSSGSALREGAHGVPQTTGGSALHEGAHSAVHKAGGAAHANGFDAAAIHSDPVGAVGSNASSLIPKESIRAVGDNLLVVGKKGAATAAKGGLVGGKLASGGSKSLLLKTRVLGDALSSLGGMTGKMSAAIKASKPMMLLGAINGTKAAGMAGHAAQAVSHFFIIASKAIGSLVATALMAAKNLSLLGIVMVVATFLSSFLGSLGIEIAQQERKVGRSVAANVPPEYAQYVNQAGSMCPEITAPLIAAQIEAESGWNPAAKSPVGAQGISQFMPGTWATQGGDYNGDGRADPLDPADAIPSQGHFMCSIVETLNPHVASGAVAGSIQEVALAGYNAGPGAVISNGGIPPYAETQNYVSKILALMVKYQAAQDVAAVGGSLGDALEWAKSIAMDDTNHYVLGSQGPTAWDCSGLTGAFMARLGVALPRTAREQSTAPGGVDVPYDQMQPGDLIFWDWGDGSWHTAIALGGGQMVSADSPESGINIEPVFPGVRNVRRFL